MTSYEFHVKVEKDFSELKYSGYRYGQVLFNTLARVRPDLSEQIRGTKLDPFYADVKGGGIQTIKAAKAWITQNWQK